MFIIEKLGYNERKNCFGIIERNCFYFILHLSSLCFMNSPFAVLVAFLPVSLCFYLQSSRRIALEIRKHLGRYVSSPSTALASDWRVSCWKAPAPLRLGIPLWGVTDGAAFCRIRPMLPSMQKACLAFFPFLSYSPSPLPDLFLEALP